MPLFLAELNAIGGKHASVARVTIGISLVIVAHLIFSTFTAAELEVAQAIVFHGFELVTLGEGEGIFCFGEVGKVGFCKLEEEGSGVKFCLGSGDGLAKGGRCF
ncbi:MAG: hypothetical protein S4CHLAM102_04340 [Chlamydiia bacterium]|nr:hypothetical protein [Chlamydiia bacterium]